MPRQARSASWPSRPIDSACSRCWLLLFLVTAVGCKTYRAAPRDGGDARASDGGSDVEPSRDAALDADQDRPANSDQASDREMPVDSAADLRADTSGDSALPRDLSKIAAPRLVAPISTATVTARRPALRWVLASDTDGARVQICRDRACSNPVVSFDVNGASGAPTTDLPAGVLFWRAWGRSGGDTGTPSTATWQFNVGTRSAPVNTAWGTTLDVNGDGYADVLVGADQVSRAYIYLGGPSGLSPTQQPITLTGPAGSRFGSSVASAGDVNGDGYGDIIVGAFGAFGFTGAAYVYLGGALGVSATQEPIALTGPDGTFAGFAEPVASAGDVNGDGYSDIIVGASAFGDANTPPGRLHLYLGGPTGPVAANPLTIDGPDGPGGRFGNSVAGAGDVNGDGYSDVVVGAWGLSNFTGRFHIYAGSATGLSTSPMATITGPDGANGFFGGDVAGAGDTNGDGYTDVLIGTRVGKAYLYLGGASGVSTSQQPIIFMGGGSGIGSAGDINGDGFGDIVSDNLAYQSGPVGGPSPVGSRVALTNPDGVSSGATGLGDINGDGYADVATTNDGYMDCLGRVYIYFGSAAGLTSTQLPIILTGPDADGEFGISVASAGGPRNVPRSSPATPSIRRQPFLVTKLAPGKGA